MADTFYHPQRGEFGAFSPEGIAFLQQQIRPVGWEPGQEDPWIAAREQIASARTGGKKPMNKELVRGYKAKTTEDQRLIDFLLSAMLSQSIRPGTGTSWGNSWLPPREGLGDTGQFK